MSNEQNEIVGVSTEEFKRMWPRALGAIMGQVQEAAGIAASVHQDSTALFAESKKLIYGAMAVVREAGDKHKSRIQDAKDTFEHGADLVKAATAEVVAEVTQAHDAGVRAVVGAFDSCMDVVEKVGNEIERQLTGPAQVMADAAASLAAASLKADADHVAAMAERMRLVDYMGQLEAYKLELDAHEKHVAKRCAAAKAKAMTGLSFWKRVFAPPAPVPDLPKAPVRPKPPATPVRESMS